MNVFREDTAGWYEQVESPLAGIDLQEVEPAFVAARLAALSPEKEVEERLALVDQMCDITDWKYAEKLLIELLNREEDPAREPIGELLGHFVAQEVCTLEDAAEWGDVLFEDTNLVVRRGLELIAGGYYKLQYSKRRQSGHLNDELNVKRAEVALRRCGLLNILDALDGEIDESY